jgi:hypothetical protein
MWERLSGAQKVKVVLTGFVALIVVLAGIGVVVVGIWVLHAPTIWVRGIIAIFVGLNAGYVTYKMARTLPGAPES